MKLTLGGLSQFFLSEPLVDKSKRDVTSNATKLQDWWILTLRVKSTNPGAWSHLMSRISWTSLLRLAKKAYLRYESGSFGSFLKRAFSWGVAEAGRTPSFGRLGLPNDGVLSGSATPHEKALFKKYPKDPD